MGALKLTYYGSQRALAKKSLFLVKGLEKNGITEKKRLNAYRYGFNGQEKDDAVKGSGNSINYKARVYDPRLGRFFAVDPLIWKFPYYSPYQFASNSPIIAIDMEGLQSSFRLNFPEGSVEVIDGQLKYSELSKISEDRVNFFPIGINRIEPVEGEFVKVICSDCQGIERNTTGRVVNIKVGKGKINVVAEEEVEVTIPGSEGSPPVKEPKLFKAEQGSTFQIDGKPTSFKEAGTRPNTNKSLARSLKFKLDELKKNKDFVSVESIALFFPEGNTLNIAKLQKELSKVTDVNVNIKTDKELLPAKSNTVIEYKKDVVTKEAVPPTEAKTEKKTVLKEKAVESVEPL